ncbi:MAG: transglycosylase SLT domain-containing protein, partial [Alcanivorax sp.]|nr:transglycosylase SLT domain-containing protein [Alcanivorax sp.]
MCCLFFSPMVLASARDTFAQALDAARNDDWQTLAEQQKKLGDDYPLQAYLDFHRLRAALPDLPPGRIKAYAARYPDSPLPRDIKQQAIVAYAKAEKWDALLDIATQPPKALELRCYYYRARIDTHRKDSLKAARELWLSGQSRPASCDPLFDEARKAGVIDDQAIWERQKLAFHARSSGLQRYLNQMMADSKLMAVSDWLMKLYRDPTQVTALPAFLNKKQRQALVAAGVRRWAYVDTVAARQWFEQHSREQGLTDPQLRQQSARRIAWYSTIRGIKENRDWLDHWLKDNADPALLEQRARLAIVEQQWAQVNHWISRLPDADQQDAHWLYWHARALEETHQESQARALYQQAARQRNFFAFMAADRLGEPYRFSNASETADTSEKQPALVRIKILRAIDEQALARKEWQWLLWHSDTDKVKQLAQTALNNHWYDLAVQASIDAGAWDMLAWRFPPAYEQQFKQAARQYDLDPWLAMAVARRESGFNPHARSSVGALGLMQLMPATARKVARKANQSLTDTDQLFTPATNSAL